MVIRNSCTSTVQAIWCEMCLVSAIQTESRCEGYALQWERSPAMVAKAVHVLRNILQVWSSRSTIDTEYIVNDHSMLWHIRSECMVCCTRCVGCLTCVVACTEVSECVMVGVNLEDKQTWVQWLPKVAQCFAFFDCCLNNIGLTTDITKC